MELCEAHQTSRATVLTDIPLVAASTEVFVLWASYLPLSVEFWDPELVAL